MAARYLRLRSSARIGAERYLARGNDRERSLATARWLNRADFIMRRVARCEKFVLLQLFPRPLAFNIKCAEYWVTRISSIFNRLSCWEYYNVNGNPFYIMLDTVSECPARSSSLKFMEIAFSEKSIFL